MNALAHVVGRSGLTRHPAIRTDRAEPSSPAPWRWRVAPDCPAHPHVLRLDAKGVGRWLWRTQGDERVRPAHQALEGREFGPGEKHPTEGRPGDAYGCRCYLEIIPIGDDGAKPSRKVERVVERATAKAKGRGQATADKFQAKRSAARAQARGDSRPLAVRLDASAITVTPEGYWLVRGVAGAGDMLLDYPEYGRTEWRSLGELIKAAPSLLHKPITIEHEADEVDPSNWQAVTHGFVTEQAVNDAGELEFAALITTAEGQQALREGLTKLSLAYRLDPLAARTPVTLPDGRVAGGQQIGITFDNLTLTARPRAGELAAIRLDEAPPTMERLPITATRTDARGRTHTIRGLLPALLLAGLQASAVDAGTRTDEDLPVGKLSITKSDGSKVDLTLPDGMLGDVLAMIGAGAPAETPAPAADELPEPEAAATATASPEGVKLDEAPTAGAEGKNVDSMRETLRTDAHRRDVEHRARPLFGARPMAGLDAPGIAAAAVRLAGLDDATCRRADSLAKSARTLDPFARGLATGQLDELLERAITKHGADAAAVRTDSAGGFPLEFFAPPAKPGAVRTDAIGDARERQIKRRTERLIKAA